MARTTTEDHRQPSMDEIGPGTPLLLAAFPIPAALSPPPSGQVVGRDWLAAAAVRDREVSSAHARFHCSPGGLQIEDVGSRNGTFVDGRRLARGERQALGDGAVIRLGRTLLVHRPTYAGTTVPAPPLGRLIAPWGLTEVRGELERIRASGRSADNVLIQGDTGTGKELLAAAVIHAMGRQRRAINVNVAGIAAGVFEAQLFGWVKGAYSGSGEGSKGILREAEGGAVFLDELGELPAELQPKLLRVLENREVFPVGASRPTPVDVALVAATNRALDDEVERGAFRGDLLARFASRFTIPPLDERPEDLWAILVDLGARGGVRLEAAEAEVEAVERLLLASFPGNTRDLVRLVGQLGPGETLTLRIVDRVIGPPRAAMSLTPAALESALAACGGNQSAAARRLGITRGTMRRRMEEWGLGRKR